MVVLTCEATGDPKPSITWSKDGNTSIPRAQFRNDGHILVIQEVAPSDGGIYECKASNIFGQRRTTTAVVIAGKYHQLWYGWPKNKIFPLCEQKLKTVDVIYSNPGPHDLSNYGWRLCQSAFGKC